VPSPPAIALTEPTDGSVYDSLTVMFVRVSGKVAGNRYKGVRIFLNGTPVEAPVRDGIFHSRFLLDKPENVVYVESADEKGETVKSETAAFKVTNLCRGIWWSSRITQESARPRSLMQLEASPALSERQTR